MKWGVVVFPGSNCDQDCVHVLREVVGQPVAELWHQETSLRGCDAIVLPGGFSYGDYLRTGAVARFSPIMQSVGAFARDGGLVLGICNGFQILLESGLLPGAMLRNAGLQFVCKFVSLRVERTDTPFTNRYRDGQIIRLPIAHNEGRYTADAPSTRTTASPARLLQLPGRAGRGLAQDSAPRSITAGLHKTLADVQDHVVFRYTENPNGSTDAIAGITNRAGNVCGLMPHPERASEDVLGSADGRLLFASMIEAFANA